MERDFRLSCFGPWIQLCLKLAGFSVTYNPIAPERVTLNHLHSLVQGLSVNSPKFKAHIITTGQFSSLPSSRIPPDGPGQTHTPMQILGRKVLHEFINRAFIILSHLVMV